MQGTTTVRERPPRNVAELAADAGWMKKIRTAVGRYYRNPRTRPEEDPEDLVADVFCRMLRRDEQGRDYVERWDPAKNGAASFANWVYTLVNNRCNHRYHHVTCEAGQKIRNAAIIVAEVPDDSRGGNLVAEGSLVGSSEDPAVMVGLKDLMAELAEQDPANPPRVEWGAHGGTLVEVDGKEERREAFRAATPEGAAGRTYARTATCALNLLAEGRKGSEIAELWRCRPTEVYRTVAALRAHPAVQQWRSELVGNRASPERVRERPLQVQVPATITVTRPGTIWVVEIPSMQLVSRVVDADRWSGPVVPWASRTSGLEHLAARASFV